jgi:hypothetical protein
VRNQPIRLDKTEEKSARDGEKVVCRLILFKQYERHGAVYRLSDRTYGSSSLTDSRHRVCYGVTEIVNQIKQVKGLLHSLREVVRSRVYRQMWLHPLFSGQRSGKTNFPMYECKSAATHVDKEQEIDRFSTYLFTKKTVRKVVISCIFTTESGGPYIGTNRGTDNIAVKGTRGICS